MCDFEHVSGECSDALVFGAGAGGAVGVFPFPLGAVDVAYRADVGVVEGCDPSLAFGFVCEAWRVGDHSSPSSS